MQARLQAGRLSVLCCALGSALLSGAARAAPYAYTLDPVHTRIAFTTGHAGFSKAIGTFAHPTGTLVFDEADWKTSKVAVEIPVPSLDLGDAAWNKAVLGNMFLDADKLRSARFVSTRVEDLGGGKLRITGNLTLHGVTQPVVLDATFNAHRKHPLTFRKTAGFSATATLSRKAFDLGAWPGVIDDRVEVLLEVEASAPRKPGNDPAPKAAPGDDDPVVPAPPADGAAGFEAHDDAEPPAPDEPSDHAPDEK